MSQKLDKRRVTNLLVELSRWRYDIPMSWAEEKEKHVVILT